MAIDPLVDPSNGYHLLAGSPAEGYGLQTNSVGFENELSSIVTDFELSNYPNPFNPSTSISFDLVSNSDVNLTVFNSKGNEVVNLINGQLNSGNHQIQFDAREMVSGVYYYSLRIGNKTITKKMMLLK